MDFTMQNATLEDLNELSLLMNQAHKTMEHPEWFAADDDVYLKKHLEKHGFIVTARTKDKHFPVSLSLNILLFQRTILDRY